jgi:predicted peptidase
LFDKGKGATMRSLLMTSLVVALLMAWPDRAQQDDDVFKTRSIKIGSTEYQYRVFVPVDWSKKKKWPVLLFLHGAGERGSDNEAQTRVGIGPAIQRQRETLPFVVVLPQCPKDRWWTEPEMRTLALKALEETTKEFKGDSKRTYLTGLSMGGYGSWLIAADNPKKFAAIGVICGGIRPPAGLNLPEAAKPPDTNSDPYRAVAAKLGKTHLWIFHGGADPVVPVSESRKMVEVLKAKGVDVRYTEYEGVGHNSWDKAYAEAELFPWFLSHHK